ncbi:esterase-like activity of phytase family protein [Sphingomonas mesophila]|uniref:esterase-like activity of phytase family protein n=1 Tax=Sphingomonas mesophila TaxID=2303576 RepID=UPI0013C37800|nr:esterase-like activity of phytase family protein [Sphingomonas mesophila]
MFSKSSIFNMLALLATILAGHLWLRANRPPLNLSPSRPNVHWVPVELPQVEDGSARLVGAWALRSDDPRAGGFSALALDRGRLLALSDSGVLVWLPFPGQAGPAELRPLPAVAGNPATKIGRDSEALARADDGWWTSFEQSHQLIRYDPDFRRELQRIALDARGWRKNRGVEAVAAGRELQIYAEDRGVSDAAALPDGRIALLKRGWGHGGFTAAVAVPGSADIALDLGPLDNVEGLAAQPLAGGATRLWVVTDNDNRRWRRTLLIAVDLKPTR